MNESDKKHWVFRAHVMDRAGALTSIASAFSNESISIDTVVGHGLEERAGIDGSVVLTCWCSEREKDIIIRKVKRLTKVIELEEHPYESQSLRKSVNVRATRRLVPADVVGETAFLTCELVKKNPLDWIYFLAGSPSELDPILARLESLGVITDIVYSLIGL